MKELIELGNGKSPATSESRALIRLPQLDPGAVEAPNRSVIEPPNGPWQIIWRHKGMIFLATLLGGAAALSLTIPQKPVYKAQASLEVQSLNENFLNMRDVNPNAAEPTFTPEYEIQTQVRLLQSPSILKGTLARMAFFATQPVHADVDSELPRNASTS